MLDLQKLEENLDQALAKETSESLTQWLQEKRAKRYLQNLGQGIFVAKAQISVEVHSSKSNVPTFESGQCDVYSTTQFPIAA